MRRYFFITIFLTIFTAILFAGDLVVYESLALLLRLEDPLALVVLGFALVVLTGSFIAASVIGSWHFNSFTRVYYSISALWIGFFSYFFLSSTLYGIVVGIEIYTGLDLVSHALGTTLFLAAFGLGVYGVFHGRKIAVKEIFVPLPNLPAEWKVRKVLWISDLHLGQLHGRNFLERVVEVAVKLSADVVFIGGDLYDGIRSVDANLIIAPLRRLSAPFGIFFVTGNHEEFGDHRMFLEAVKSAGIRVLADEKVDIHRLQIIGVDYERASDRKRFAETLSSLHIDRERPSVLLKHEPRDIDVAADAGISFQISGHTHHGQQWPFEYLARLVYGKFACGLSRFKNMQVYVSSGVGTWGPPLRVGTDSEIVLIQFQDQHGVRS